MPTILSSLGDLTLANRMRPHLIWPSRAITHDQMHFAFRREFRPLDILQLIFSPVSHPYRGNATLLIGGLVALVFLFWVWVLVLLFVVLVLVSVFLSPVNMLRFLSFYDDLGTPPTWRPHSCKKISG